MMTTRVDLDKATERAWEVLHHDLARRFEMLQPGESVTLEIEGPEREEFPSTPYVEISWDHNGSQAIATLPRNRAIVERLRLTRPARQRLKAAGWERVDDGYQLAADDALELATLVTTTFRERWGVQHPSFLVDSADLIEDFSEDPDDPASTPEREIGPRPLRLRGALEPDHPDQLREWVSRALSEHIGCEVVHDEDEDIPFVSSDAVVFVRVSSADAVRLFCHVVIDVTDHRMAAHEVAVLNRDVPHLKFLLREDRITMTYDVPAMPFVAVHLTQMLDLAIGTVGHLAADVAFRVGGRSFRDPADSEGDA